MKLDYSLCANICHSVTYECLCSGHVPIASCKDSVWQISCDIGAARKFSGRVKVNI